MEKKVTRDTTDEQPETDQQDEPQTGTSDTWPAAPNGPETREPAEITAIEAIQALQAERDDLVDQLQRSRAEFINYRRRTDQERTVVRQVVTRDVLAQFLPVLDDFQRALEAIPKEERTKGWEKGIELIANKLTAVLERAGVSPIDALGQPFDPSIHEAVATEPDSSGSHVVEVYQTGYRLGDNLMRPSMVKTGDPAEHHANSHHKGKGHGEHPHAQA